MSSNDPYAHVELTRDEVDALRGPVIIEFGTNWCGYCQGAQRVIGTALAGHDAVRHIKVEDGKGRRLGRSFAVKLWPTLIFMRDGLEVARAVRPDNAQDLIGPVQAIEAPALPTELAGEPGALQ
ncbi:MAG: thioredoxin family protein [Rhodocyclaceae bacterium]